MHAAEDRRLANDSKKWMGWDWKIKAKVGAETKAGVVI